MLMPAGLSMSHIFCSFAVPNNSLAMNKTVLRQIAALAAVALLALCGACRRDDFKVDGTVEGASDTMLLLEKAGFDGRWMAVDSTRTDRAGRFSMSRPRPAAPEVFRLSMDGRYIYFPIDSTETVTVTADASAFDNGYTLAGSRAAADMAAFDSELRRHLSDTSSLTQFKREVFDRYMRGSRGGIVSYYALTKTVGGKPLYDPADETDVKYYAAVATAFRQFRPDDPRTALLEGISLEAMRRRNAARGRQLQLNAREVRLIDIELTDAAGRTRRLSDVAGHGKAVVVAFTLLGHEDTPALNKLLSDLRSSKAGRVEIFNVGLDADRYAWRDAVASLPWICVHEPAGASSEILARYNVGSLPTFFVYNPQGELVARAGDSGALARELSGY